MRPHALVVALVAALVAAGSPAPAAAETVETFGAGGSRAKVKDMALIEDASGTYSDKYTVDADFKGGGDFYISIEQGNYGSGDRGLKVVSRYRAPDGTTYRTEEKLARGKWTQTVGATLDLRMGRHRLQGTPQEWTFTAEDDEKRFALTFRPTAPPWRPGAGRAKFGGDYLDMTVLAPRATVAGTLRMGETVREVTGSGYALHTYSTLAPHELAKRMVGVRAESGPLAFFVKEIEPAARWSGAEPLRWLLVARKGEVIFETTDFTFTPAEVTPDAKHPNRYPVPHAFQLEAKDGDRTLTAVVKATKQTERADRLAEVSAVERAIAAQFAQPVYYSFSAVYEARIDDGSGTAETFKGKGVYELDHLNK